MATMTKKRKTMNKRTLNTNLNSIKDALSETSDGVTERARELLSNLIDDINEKKSDYIEIVEDFVDRKPFKSLGLALLTGYLIGKVIL